MTSSGNPRKFSEKIAIQQRKLNEEQSAFQQIMNEVHTITQFPTPVAAQALGAPNWSHRMATAGSLPSLPNVFDFSYPGSAGQRPSVSTNYNNAFIYPSNQWPVGVPMTSAAAAAAASAAAAAQQRVMMSGGAFPHQVGIAPSGAAHRGRSPIANAAATHYHPYQRTPSPHHSPGGGASPSSLRNRSPDRPPRLTPPSAQQQAMACGAGGGTSGGGTAFLTPPLDSGWRRTHSDPGIHASVAHPQQMDIIDQQQQAFNMSGSIHNHSSTSNSPSGDLPLSAGYLDPKMNYYTAGEKSRSNEATANMNTLSINACNLSAGSSQTSISSNTGSLPDLSQSAATGTCQASPQQQQVQLTHHHHQQQPLQYSQSLGYGPCSSGMQQHPGAPLMGGHLDNSMMTAGGTSSGSGHHQQRHSIQLPVQYAQGHFGAAAGGGFSFGGSQSGSPSYSQTESPHSGPNSPATTANSESPGASQQGGGQSSPGSPYYSLPSQMQNINIDTCEMILGQQQQQQPFYASPGQQSSSQQYKVQMQNQYNQSGGQYHQAAPGSLIMQPPSYQQATTSPGQYGGPQNNIGGDIFNSQQQQQQPLASPKSGKIPNIILTGPCDTLNMHATHQHGGSYIDPTVALLSSDLRLTLDPSDLESLQILTNENDIIDAASEDALRRD